MREQEQGNVRFFVWGKRKLELIRELLEQRMRDHGFTDIDSRLKVKQLGNTELMGTPEAAIVTIIETVFSMQKQGRLLGQIINDIEAPARVKVVVLTCPGIFDPRVFRDNGSSNLRSSDEASEVYRRADCSDLAGGRPGTSG